MSSGWPPEEDDRRWEHQRHASAVGAAHDARDPARGYSGYARHALNEGGSGEPADAYDPGQGYPAGGWYAAPPAPRDGADHSGSYPTAGYGQAAGDAGTYDPGSPETGYGTPGYDGTAGYGGAGYGEPRYEDAGYQAPGYHDAAAGPAAGAQDAAVGPYASQAGSYRSQTGYQDGPRYPAAAGYGQGAEVQDGFGHQGHAGQDGYAGSGENGYAGSGQNGYSGAAYELPGNQDYGDPGYDDPGYGDPGYGDAQYPGPDQQPPALGPGYGDGGYLTDEETSYPAHPAPVYADQGYRTYPAAGQDDSAGYDQTTGYGQEPDAGARYATDYPGTDYPGAEAGRPPQDRPDQGEALGSMRLAPTTDFTDDTDGTGPFAYRYARSTDYTGGSGPLGPLDGTGLLDPPAEFFGPPARPGHGGAAIEDTAADGSTSVLDRGTAGFADPRPAEVTSFDLPAAGQASGYFADAAPAEVTSFDLPAAGDAAGFFGGAPAADATSVDLPAAAPGEKTTRLARPRLPRTPARPAGRRRGRSGDRRLWLALGGLGLAAVVAIVAIVMVAFPSGPSGPPHTLVTPDRLSSFLRRPALEQQMNVGQLRKDVVAMSSGQASHVVEAVYEAGTSTTGQTPQILLFIGGNLANASPQASVNSFTQRFKGASVTSAGRMAGDAACVNATASEPGSVAMCAWFDNDSFGEVVSPTMNASALAGTMRTIRPDVELIAKPKR